MTSRMEWRRVAARQPMIFLDFLRFINTLLNVG